MAVDNVKDHKEAEAVRLVDEVLEVVGRSIAARRCKEAGHVVAKTAIVSMLHDSHKLDTGVAEVADVREDVVGKIPVGRNLGLG